MPDALPSVQQQHHSNEQLVIQVTSFK